MIDLKELRQNQDKFKKALAKKAVVVDLDKLLSLDDDRREVSLRLDNNRHKLKVLSQEPSAEKKAAAKLLKTEIKRDGETLNGLESEIAQILQHLPNLPLDDVPEGGAEANDVINVVGEVPKFDFPVKSYLELAEKHDWLDIKRAAKVAGTRFGYLKREAALLELALVQYAFDALSGENFIPVIPPVLLRPELLKAQGRIPPGQEEERYYLPKDDLYLAGSAEHTIAPMHADEIFSEAELPKRYLGFSSCFRREAGSYGQDTKGILRVHQFDKVEMFSFVLPHEDEAELNRLVAWQEKLQKGLELPYRVVLIAAGDIGWPEAKLYDIETWIPSENRYRETHSASTTTDFQARGLNIRYRTTLGKTNYVHTLNATAIAVPRTIIAILENHQRSDGKVSIPKALQKYLGLKTIPH